MFSSSFVCVSVGLLAALRKSFQTDLHEIFSEGWQWASEQVVKFWWRSGLRIRIRIRIVTLVRRALAEVGTVAVLVVLELNCSFVLLRKYDKLMSRYIVLKIG